MNGFLFRFWRNIILIGGGYWLGAGFAFITGTTQVPFMLAGIALGTVGSVVSERSVRESALRRHVRQPRPDYALIARMEREIWGRAFDHAGAPSQSAAKSSQRDTATVLTAHTWR